MRSGVIAPTVAILSLGLLPLGAQAQKGIDLRAEMKKAVTRSLPLLQSSAHTFKDHVGTTCFSCHHQSLPSMAVAIAKSRGYKIDEKLAAEQTGFVHELFVNAKPLLAASSKGNTAMEQAMDRVVVDPAATVGYGLYGLAESNIKPDEPLELAALYLAKKQCEDGRWPIWGARPPMEGSEFTATALAVRDLQMYAPKDRAEEMAGRIARAKAWLLATMPRSTEDKAFRLFGLAWTKAEKADIDKAVADLLADQRDDGGWAQLPGKGSDAYATGEVLVALNQAGGMPITHSAYMRGAVYLLLSQRPDGSWRVQKRANPAQPYFDAGFPHKTDQFISICGTSWATAALALTVEPTTKTVSAQR